MKLRLYDLSPLESPPLVVNATLLEHRTYCGVDVGMKHPTVSNALSGRAYPLLRDLRAVQKRTNVVLDILA